MRPLVQLSHLFLGSQSSQVEGQFFTFQDVTVTSAGLTWSGRNAGVQSTGAELGVDSLLDLSVGSSGGPLLLGVLGLRNNLLLNLTRLLLTQSLTVVRLVPLSEWGSVDLDDGGLGQSVSSDQLVVGRVVDDTGDSGLSGDTLGGPSEVTGLDSQGSELLVTTSGSDSVDSLVADLGVGWLTAQFELSLLSELSTLGTGSSSLVARITRNTHLESAAG